MGVFDSPATTYSDTTPQKRVITDIISLIDPSDAPMVDALGGLDGASGKFRFTENGMATVTEWLEDTLIDISGTLNESATITSTVTTLVVTDGSIHQEGQIVKIDSELAWVSDVSTNTITVTRGVAGSTKASHDSVATVDVVGMARLEGDDSDDIGFTDRTTGSNWTSIFHQEVKASRTHRQIAQYGIADELNYQADKVVPSLMRLIERMAFQSKAGSAGSASTPRIFGGLQAFISTNKVAGTTLAKSQFDSAVKLAWQAGGTGPWLAPVSAANYQKISDFYNSTTVLRIERTETTVGVVIKQIETPFGTVNLLLDRWAPDTLIFLIDPKHAGFRTFYPFTQEPLAKTGDADKAQVIGEFSLCVRQDKAHALLTAVS